MYQQHPSPELNELFRARPFQGVPPERAEIVFVGLDANYAPDIESTPSFASILDYHRDGVAFWRRNRLHHPFLLPEYRGGGRAYHRNFARIGFNPDDAERISFVELLHVPTVGRSRLEIEDLDPMHLDAVGAVVLAGVHRHVFVSAGVVELMRKSRRFGWLPTSRPRTPELLPVLHRVGNTCVYLHLHFSNYGKFRVQMDLEAMAIKSLLCKRMESADPSPPSTSSDPEVMRSIEHVVARAISPASVCPDGWLTAPQSYGVYRIPSSAGSARTVRFGNHPVRQRELEREFGSCNLEYLFINRGDAKAVALALALAGQDQG